jgi:hypothetical protein
MQILLLLLLAGTVTATATSPTRCHTTTPHNFTSRDHGTGEVIGLQHPQVLPRLGSE